MKVDLDELERLAAKATPGPWYYDATGVFKWHFLLEKRHVCEFVTEANAVYITAACNALPELIAENRELRERVRELEIREVDYIEERDALLCTKYALERQNAGLEARNRYLMEERDTLEWELHDIKRGLEAAKEAGE
jgi:cell division protein FtsB